MAQAATKKSDGRNATVYSDRVQGDKGNYDWPVIFDKTRGYVGIVQYDDTGVQRVLLSPDQIKALVKFIK